MAEWIATAIVTVTVTVMASATATAVRPGKAGLKGRLDAVKSEKFRRSRPAGENPVRVRDSHPPGSQPCAGTGNGKAMRRQARWRAVYASPEISQKPRAQGVVVS
jgi:hypothetical protein